MGGGEGEGGNCGDLCDKDIVGQIFWYIWIFGDNLKRYQDDRGGNSWSKHMKKR